MNQPEQSASSRVKRGARAAELPDENEQGEGLTTVDTEEIPVDEEIVKSHRGRQEERT